MHFVAIWLLLKKQQLKMEAKDGDDILWSCARRQT